MRWITYITLLGLPACHTAGLPGVATLRASSVRSTSFGPYSKHFPCSSSTPIRHSIQGMPANMATSVAMCHLCAPLYVLMRLLGPVTESEFFPRAIGCS